MTVSQTDRYVPQKKLGSGAMGEVWLATDTLLGRPVAIKYLRVQNRQYRDLFVNEARQLARLNHPNITAIYDAVFDEQAGYSLVMEYVPGRSLDDVLAEQGPLDVDAALELALGILRALQFAHQHGVVHRDIKPANVIIADQVKVTDFGLADLTSRLLHGTGYMAGTPGYMPPEQIRGERTDARSDLYALGITLFEMLAGTLPFDYEDQDDLIVAPIRQTPHALRKFAPDAPLVLEHTIAKLLAPDPDDRYPSADVLLNVLSAIQARRTFSQPGLQLLDPSATPFVDRASELSQLAAWWTQTRETGAPHLVMVHGEAGIGKDRLAAEFLGQVADEGYAALVGRCDEFGEPYTPFAHILATIFQSRAALSLTEADRSGHLLSQIPSLAHALDLHRSAVPQTASQQPAASGGMWAALTERVPGAVAGPAAPEQAQWRFYDTVLFIVAELGPAVFFFQDAQHLDQASTALIRFMLRRGRIPALFVAARRDDEGPTPTSAGTWLPGEMSELTLQPLSAPASRELLAGVLGGPASDELTQVVYRRSHGNPRYIEEVARHLRDTGAVRQGDAGEWRYQPDQDSEPLPPALLTRLHRRLDALAPDARQALEIAAVIGPEFHFDTWVALLGGESALARALDVLDAALAHHLLREAGGDRYAFYPAALADVLVAALAVPRRRYLEGRVAEIDKT
ncbi:MAG: protein kinase [Chloroflexi bacterium]|nr:protein kinase [Chloroflexota bacterium]MBU1748319.1 protein kinase [Chloroflexota bacterium]